MPTATKLSPKKPARKVAGAKKKFPAHGIKAAPGNSFAGLEHVFGSVALPACSALPSAKSTSAELLKKVHSGEFAKQVDLGKVAAAVAARSTSHR